MAAVEFFAGLPPSGDGSYGEGGGYPISLSAGLRLMPWLRHSLSFNGQTMHYRAWLIPVVAPRLARDAHFNWEVPANFHRLATVGTGRGEASWCGYARQSVVGCGVVFSRVFHRLATVATVLCIAGPIPTLLMRESD